MPVPNKQSSIKTIDNHAAEATGTPVHKTLDSPLTEKTRTPSCSRTLELSSPKTPEIGTSTPVSSSNPKVLLLFSNSKSNVNF